MENIKCITFDEKAKAAIPQDIRAKMSADRLRAEKPLQNCLAYALRFWEKNPDYLIWYNSGHCINIPTWMTATFEGSPSYMPAEGYGYNYFKGAFAGLLDEYELNLLAKYFDQSPNNL